MTAAALIAAGDRLGLADADLLRKDYNGVRTELGHPMPAIILLLFALVATYHMHIGMRSIILDYVQAARANGR